MKKELIAHKIPKSPISEIFRTLRTNIQFMNTKEGLKTLMITSAGQGEGKSWVTANLAVTFAQAGKKVLLVDCDLRKGRQFSIFDIQPTPGISNFLSGIDSSGNDSSDNILEYVCKTGVENLSILPAGNVPPNPSELLISERMQNCIEELKRHFDLILFDTTPSTLVTDAVIISRYVDTTIIVASYKSTKMEDLKSIKREIQNVGGKIAGVVINKVPTSAKKYTDAYYYGGQTSLAQPKKSNRKKEVVEYDSKEEVEEEIQEKNQENTQMSKKEENINTEELLRQIGEYIQAEKDKLNGDNND